MRITNEPIEGKTVKKVLMATSHEEITILRALVMKGLENTPETEDTTKTIQLMRNMKRSMSTALGMTKPKEYKYEKIPCGICEAKIRGHKGLEMHRKVVHPDSIAHLDPDE